MLQNIIIAAAILLVVWLYFRRPSVKVPAGAFRVVDGDGVNIHHDKIRIIGFDAPEWNQPGGEDATDALTIFTLGGFVLRPSGQIDSYGRILARLFVKRRFFGIPYRTDVAILMLAAGQGHSNVRGRQWLEAHGRAELKARIMGRGLWAKSGFMGILAQNPKYWRRQLQHTGGAIACQMAPNVPAEPRRAPLPRFKPKRPMFPRDLL